VTPTLLFLAAAYTTVVAFLAVVLLSTSISLPARAVATVLAVGLMYGTYVNIGDLRGWPSFARLPESFHLLSGFVVEPNPMIGDPGRIFLWVEALDENNFPSGIPRAYQLPYTPDVAERVQGALELISEGDEMLGKLDDSVRLQDTAERMERQMEETGEVAPNLDTVGERYVPLNTNELTFGPLPAPITPDKLP
jgi:hypothetical protein